MESGFTTDHRVKLQGLSYRAKYSFQIVAWTEDGNAGSSSQEFETDIQNVIAEVSWESGATARSVWIRFTTSLPGNSWVKYGTSPNRLSEVSGQNEALYDHFVEITDLDPSMTYYFQVRSRSTDGQLAAGEVMVFSVDDTSQQIRENTLKWRQLVVQGYPWIDIKQTLDLLRKLDPNWSSSKVAGHAEWLNEFVAVYKRTFTDYISEYDGRGEAYFRSELTKQAVFIPPGSSKAARLWAWNRLFMYGVMDGIDQKELGAFDREVEMPILLDKNKEIEQKLYDVYRRYEMQSDLRWFFAYNHWLITAQINDNYDKFDDPAALIRLNLRFASEFLEAANGNPHTAWAQTFARCSANEGQPLDTDTCGLAMAKAHITVDIGNALYLEGCIPEPDFGNTYFFVDRAMDASLLKLHSWPVAKAGKMMSVIMEELGGISVRTMRNSMYTKVCHSDVPDVSSEFKTKVRPIRESPPSEPPNSPISVTVNGRKVKFDPPLALEGERVLVPLGAITRELNLMVDWVPDTDSLFISRGTDRLFITVGSGKASFNGRPITLSPIPRYLQGITYLPVRLVEAFGAKVEWDGLNHQISIELR